MRRSFAPSYVVLHAGETESVAHALCYSLLPTYEHIILVCPIQPCTTIADRELQLVLRAKLAADILKQKPYCYLKMYRAIAVLP